MDLYLKTCKEHGLAIDTNMLNVLIVGMKDKYLIPSTKSTQDYEPEDFEKIWKLLDICRSIIVSTYVLPEVSNTLPLDYKQKKGREGKVSPFVNEAKQLFEMDKITEKYEVSDKIIKHEAFDKFGVTDTAIIDLAEKGYAILSNDGPLVGYLRGKKYNVKNISELRKYYFMANI